MKKHTDEEIISAAGVTVNMLCNIIDDISDDMFKSGAMYATMRLFLKHDPSAFLRAVSDVIDECMEAVKK